MLNLILEEVYMADDKYKRYEKNQKAKGLQKIHPWVPEGDVDRAMRYCERLRKAHAKKMKKEEEKTDG